MKVISDKTVEEATVENVTEETVKKPKIALVGVKKGAIAAKQAATKMLPHHRDCLIVGYMVPVTDYPMGPFSLL